LRGGRVRVWRVRGWGRGATRTLRLLRLLLRRALRALARGSAPPPAPPLAAVAAPLGLLVVVGALEERIEGGALPLLPLLGALHGRPRDPRRLPRARQLLAGLTAARRIADGAGRGKELA